MWRQQRGKQGLLVIDGYRFLEENRLTEHASIWQRSAPHSSEENSFTLDQSCLLLFFHVTLNILYISHGKHTAMYKGIQIMPPNNCSHSNVNNKRIPHRYHRKSPRIKKTCATLHELIAPMQPFLNTSN